MVGSRRSLRIATMTGQKTGQVKKDDMKRDKKRKADTMAGAPVAGAKKFKYPRKKRGKIPPQAKTKPIKKRRSNLSIAVSSTYRPQVAVEMKMYAWNMDHFKFNGRSNNYKIMYNARSHQWCDPKTCGSKKSKRPRWNDYYRREFVHDSEVEAGGFLAYDTWYKCYGRIQGEFGFQIRSAVWFQMQLAAKPEEKIPGRWRIKSPRIYVAPFIFLFMPDDQRQFTDSLYKLSKSKITPLNQTPKLPLTDQDYLDDDCHASVTIDLTDFGGKKKFYLYKMQDGEDMYVFAGEVVPVGTLFKMKEEEVAFDKKFALSSQLYQYSSKLTCLIRGDHTRRVPDGDRFDCTDEIALLDYDDCRLPDEEIREAFRMSERRYEGNLATIDEKGIEFVERVYEHDEAVYGELRVKYEEHLIAENIIVAAGGPPRVSPMVNPAFLLRRDDDEETDTADEGKAHAKKDSQEDRPVHAKITMKVKY